MSKDMRLPRPPEGCQSMTVKKDGWKVTFEKEPEPQRVGLSVNEIRTHERDGNAANEGGG